MQAPFFALVAFGIYSVICLTVGLLTFRTVPEEHESLLKVSILCKVTCCHKDPFFFKCKVDPDLLCISQDIAEAKADLISKGVISAS